MAIKVSGAVSSVYVSPLKCSTDRDWTGWLLLSWTLVTPLWSCLALLLLFYYLAHQKLIVTRNPESISGYFINLHHCIEFHSRTLYITLHISCLVFILALFCVCLLPPADIDLPILTLVMCTLWPFVWILTMIFQKAEIKSKKNKTKQKPTQNPVLLAI